MKYALILLLVGFAAALGPRLRRDSDARHRLSRWIRFGVLAGAVILVIWLL